MKVNNYKAYKVILLATLAKEEYPNYGTGKILPLRIWDMNSLDKGTIEKNLKFEKIRKENYASLPSRIKNNIFVFANKDYADKWIAQIYGKSLVHCHISDHNAQSSCLPVGEGEFDVPSFFSLLNKNEYNGAVILELYRRNFGEPEELKKSVDLMKSLF